jgi:hypothetical protein
LGNASATASRTEDKTARRQQFVMREAGHIERRASDRHRTGLIEIVAGAMQSDRQQAVAAPVVEPLVDERHRASA